MGDKANRITEDEKKVKDLGERFAEWYYVTLGESFRSIALDREALVRAKSEAKPPGMPSGMPGMEGLPPGFSLSEGFGGPPPAH